MDNISLVPGSVGKRILAMFIDGFILIIPTVMINAAIPVLGPILIGVLYKPIFESSAAQATPGKRAMNLMVTNLTGARIQNSVAFTRYFVAVLSSCFLFAGHFFAFFTNRKQTAHDLVSNTLVVEGSTHTDIFQSWLEHIKKLIGNLDSQATPAAQKPESTKFELIEKLQKLRESGAITEEEFNKEKAKILSE